MDTSSNANSGCVHKPELTERETEVLHLLMDGLSNKEMARALYVSERTVKNHLTSMFAKMEVRDPTQAVLYAIQKGLL